MTEAYFNSFNQSEHYSDLFKHISRYHLQILIESVVFLAV